MISQQKLPFPFNAVNSIGNTMHRIGLSPFSLEANKIKRHAMRTTGLSDFGDPHYEVGLAKLLESGEKDRLNFLGLATIDTFAKEFAQCRLTWVEAQKRWPTAFETPLTPPIIVLGLPRTGTTFLHRMLASLPSNQAISSWRLLFPCPPAEGRADKRYQRVVTRYKIAGYMMPNLASRHSGSADSAEECIILQGMTFNSHVLCASSPVFSYAEWYISADRHKAYSEYASVLRWYQSQDKRRLVMKAPAHTAELHPLLAAVPNALIVQTHRNMSQAVNSYNSFIHTLQSSLMQTYMPQKIVDMNLRMLDMFIEKNRAARAALKPNICDIFYDELVDDPIGTVSKIYAHFGLAWEENYEARLQQYVVGNPAGKHGVHRYNSADFGITEAQIRERYQSYITEFDL